MLVGSVVESVGSVPEVVELQRNAEVLFLHRGDGGLKVVALLAAHPELFSWSRTARP